METEPKFSDKLRQLADDFDAGNFTAITVVAASRLDDPCLFTISYGPPILTAQMFAAAISGETG